MSAKWIIIGITKLSSSQQFYQNNKGSTLSIKLTDPISKTEATHCTNGAALDGSKCAEILSLQRAVMFGMDSY